MEQTGTNQNQKIPPLFIWATAIYKQSNRWNIWNSKNARVTKKYDGVQSGALVLTRIKNLTG